MFRCVLAFRAIVLPYMWLAAAATNAATGDWDRSFGIDGRVTAALPGAAFDTTSWVRQPDGRIIVAGHAVDAVNGQRTVEYIVARLNADGTPDTTFDGDGFVRFNDGISSYPDSIEIARQADGKLVVVRQSRTGGNHSRLVRLNADGSTDMSFGTSGELALRYARPTQGPRLQLATDGSIFVASVVLGSVAAYSNTVVTRVTPAGVVDTDYGANGSASIESADSYFETLAFTVMPSGAIALAGRHGASNVSAPFVARIDPLGRPDTQFGSNGIASLAPMAAVGHVDAIATAPDGRIVVIGALEGRDDRTWSFIARLTTSGVPDPTFGANGRIVTFGIASSVVVESDGKIVVSGAMRDTANSAFGWLARYGLDGLVDVSFGVRGHARADLSLDAAHQFADLGDLQRNADGSYSALAQLRTAGLSHTPGAIVRFIASGTSTPVIGVNALSELGTGVTTPEIQSTLTPRVYRTGSAEGAVSVQYRVVGETATDGLDFIAATGTLAFNDGEISASVPPIQILDDGIREPAERFYIELHSPVGAVLSKSRSIIEIGQDLETGSNVAFANAGETTIEGAAAATWILQRTGDLRFPLTMSYLPLAGTATAGVDFVDTPGTISWPANEGGPRLISVPLLNDGNAEPNETIGISLSIVGTSTMLPTANVTIVDDDGAGAPGVGLGAAQVVANESAGTASLQVLRTGDASQSLDVQWTTSSAGVTATAGQDYSAANGTVSWTAGDTTPRTIVVPLVNDAIAEGTETLLVTLTSAGASLIHSNGVVHIVDDDVPMTITIGAGTNVGEGAGTVTVPVSISAPPVGPVSVSYSFVAELANSADAVLVNGSLNWAAGDGSDKSISISIASDTVDEIDETFSIRLSGPQGGATLATASARFTILDDDPTPAGATPPGPGVQLKPSAIAVTEGAYSVVFEITRLGDVAVDLTGSCGLTSGTTLSSPDDMVSATGPYNILAGSTAPLYFEIPLNGDSVAEPDEAFNARCTMRARSSFALPPADASFTVFDDDRATITPAHVGWIKETESVDESVTSVTVQVARTGNTTIASSVDYALTAGSAGAADFAASSGTLTWLANDASIKSVTITLLPDSIDEPDETFAVTLYNPSANTELSTNIVNVTIRDDDAPAPNGGGSGGAGGGSKGGGGSENPLALLLYACMIAVAHQQRRQRARSCTSTSPTSHRPSAN